MTMRDMSWIIAYWKQKFQEANVSKIPIRELGTDDMVMQNVAIREKVSPK